MIDLQKQHPNEIDLELKDRIMTTTLISKWDISEIHPILGKIILLHASYKPYISSINLEFFSHRKIITAYAQYPIVLHLPTNPFESTHNFIYNVIKQNPTFATRIQFTASPINQNCEEIRQKIETVITTRQAKNKINELITEQKINPQSAHYHLFLTQSPEPPSDLTPNRSYTSIEKS